MGTACPERMLENMALIKSAEVCEMLGISSTKLHAMTKSGEIPAFRIGKHFHYDKDEIGKWLEEQRLAPAETERGEAV